MMTADTVPDFPFFKQINFPFLVSGFCRRHCDTYGYIPDTTVDLILNYYPQFNGTTFEWRIKNNYITEAIENIPFEDPFAVHDNNNPDTLFFDSDYFDVGLPNKFFLRLCPNVKDRIDTSKSHGESLDRRLSYSRNNKLLFALELVSFPLEKTYDSIILHAELSLRNIGKNAKAKNKNNKNRLKQYSAIWKMDQDNNNNHHYGITSTRRNKIDGSTELFFIFDWVIGETDDIIQFLTERDRNKIGGHDGDDGGDGNELAFIICCKIKILKVSFTADAIATSTRFNDLRFITCNGCVEARYNASDKYVLGPNIHSRNNGNVSKFRFDWKLNTRYVIFDNERKNDDGNGNDSDASMDPYGDVYRGRGRGRGRGGGGRGYGMRGAGRGSGRGYYRGGGYGGGYGSGYNNDTSSAQVGKPLNHYHSGIFYDMFQLQCNSKGEFSLMICDLPYKTHKMCIKCDLSVKFKSSRSGSNIFMKQQVMSEMIAFDFDNVMNRYFSKGTNDQIRKLFEKYQIITLICDVNIIQRYDTLSKCLPPPPTLTSTSTTMDNTMIENRNNHDVPISNKKQSVEDHDNRNKDNTFKSRDKKKIARVAVATSSTATTTTVEAVTTGQDENNDEKNGSNIAGGDDMAARNKENEELNKAIESCSNKIVKKFENDTFIWRVESLDEKIQGGREYKSDVFKLLHFRWFLSVMKTKDNDEIDIRAFCLRSKDSNGYYTIRLDIIETGSNEDMFAVHCRDGDRYHFYESLDKLNSNNLNQVTMKFNIALISESCSDDDSDNGDNDNSETIVVNERKQDETDANATGVAGDGDKRKAFVDVENWLKNHVKLPQYLRDFKKHALNDLNLVKLMGVADLDRLGVQKIGHRLLFLKHIARLNNKVDVDKLNCKNLD